MPVGVYIRTKEAKLNMSKAALGKIMSPEAKKKMSIAKTGKNNSLWKGDKVSYVGLHIWVKNHLGSPHICENCNNSKLNHRQYHWANLSGEYKRDLSDWARLCVKCHHLIDNIGNKVWLTRRKNKED